MVRNEKKEIGPNWVLVGMQFIIFSILLAVSIMIISNLPSFLKQNPLHRRRLALDPSLLEESKEIWAFEPGEFHRLQMKSFTYYNITNPYNVNIYIYIFIYIYIGGEIWAPALGGFGRSKGSGFQTFRIYGEPGI